jgi:hypothetical protein
MMSIVLKDYIVRQQVVELMLSSQDLEIQVEEVPILLSHWSDALPHLQGWLLMESCLG